MSLKRLSLGRDVWVFRAPNQGTILPTAVSHLNTLEAKWTSAWACPGLNSAALTTAFPMSNQCCSESLLGI
jgi:hypothetical protein